MQAQRAGRYADAIGYLQEAVKHDAGNPKYSIALASALARRAEAEIARGEEFERGGQFALAYRQFEEAFRSNPFDDRALLKRQLVSIRLRAMDESHQVDARALPWSATPAGAGIGMERSSRPIPDRSGALERASALPSAATWMAAIGFEPAKIDLALGEHIPVEVIVSARVWPSSGSFDVIYDDRVLSVANVESGATAGPYSVRQPEPGRISFRFHPEEHFDGLACRLSIVAMSPELAGLAIERARLKDGVGNELDVTTSPASINVHPAGAGKAPSASASRLP